MFSISTACQVAHQSLEAIEDLHSFGFIHRCLNLKKNILYFDTFRDVKPSNFAIGLHDKANIVYLLDFGISRKIINAEGEIKVFFTHHVFQFKQELSDSSRIVSFQRNG